MFQLCEDVSRATPLGRGKKPTDEDVSSENATFFNYVRMSRVRRPLGGTDEDVSSESVDSELIVHFTTVFRTWAC